MGMTFRVRRHGYSGPVKKKFLTQRVPSGGKIVSISNRSYLNAKKAAEKKLNQRKELVGTKPSI